MSICFFYRKSVKVFLMPDVIVDLFSNKKKDLVDFESLCHFWECIDLYMCSCGQVCVLNIKTFIVRIVCFRLMKISIKVWSPDFYIFRGAECQ